MILFAVVLPIMMGILGLAVEGGRVWVEYRRMQSAADMAALVGAQALPCGTSSSTADQTCRSNAETLACQYAANNGFPGCVGGDVTRTGSARATAAPAAFVPPITCSPYDFIDYGTNNGPSNPNANSNCKTSVTGAPSYDYVEVDLADPLLTIPIFNIPVTLYTKAVARNGTPSAKDFAVSVLDSSVGAFTITGNVPYYVNGTTFVNGSYSAGSQARNACDGGFFSASPSSVQTGVSSLITYSGGQTSFAPPQCDIYNPVQATWSQQTTPDSPLNHIFGLPPITDPYCSSYSPPTNFVSGVGTLGTTSNAVGCPAVTSNPWSGGTSMPNCPDCNWPGFWWDGSSWHQGGDVTGSTVELFPGVYNTFAISTNGKAFFNPGVYTFTGIGRHNNQATFDASNGGYYVMGSPAAEDAACTVAVCGSTNTCGGTNFGINSSAGNAWYYACSPFGKWDCTLSRSGAPVNNSSCGGHGPCLAAPTWLIRNSDGSDTVSTKPLNGVTIFIQDGNAQDSGHGNATTTAMAFPNPCVGNGTLGPANDGWIPGSPNAVSFNQGTNSSNAMFTYPAGSYAASHGYTTANANTDGIYPNIDLTKAGECANNNYEVWPGEMPIGQHVHFMWYIRQTIANDPILSLGGNTKGLWDGIMYDPNGLVDMHGNSGSSTGPPFIFGQIIGYDLQLNGTDSLNLVYRPCGDKEAACSSGPGTQLIQ